MLIALSTGDAIALAGVVVNGVGLLVIAASLLLVRVQAIATQRAVIAAEGQARETSKATLALVYQNVSQQMVEIDRFFIDHSWMKRFFYQGAKPHRWNPRREELLSAAEMFVDVMDNVLIQCPVLESYRAIQDDWENYFRSIYDSSPIMREFWSAASGWYTASPLVRVFAGDAHPESSRRRAIPAVT